MDEQPNDSDASADRRHIADRAIELSLKSPPAQQLAHFQIPRWAGPICGALVGFYLSRYSALFGQENSWAATGLTVLFGTIAGGLVWLMEIIEQAGSATSTRKPTVTFLVLLIGLATFWVPLVGLAVLSYGLYRARWLKINDWFLVPFTFFWFLSAGITIVMGMIYVMG